MKSAAFKSVLLCTAVSISAAEFRNLGFEEASTNTTVFDARAVGVVPYPLGEGPAADLLPAWEVRVGGNLVTSVGYNIVGPPYGPVGLTSKEKWTGWPLIEGNYAVEIGPGSHVVALVQRGDVPTWAQGLSLHHIGLAGSDFRVSMNGTELARLGEPGIKELFDVSPFVGQNVELAFTFRTVFVPSSPPSAMLDNITFVVPEPSITVLLVLGALARGGLQWVRRRPRQK